MKLQVFGLRAAGLLGYHTHFVGARGWGVGSVTVCGRCKNFKFGVGTSPGGIT